MLQVERVRVLGALRSLQSKKQFVAGTQWETNILSNIEKEKWIEDDVDGETTVARPRVADTETATKQERQDMRNADKAGLTTTKPETTSEVMLIAMGDGPSNLPSPDDGEDGDCEDDDEGDPDQGKLSEDDEPGWVLSMITKTA